jgi:co-chaperonin GroES (HSP10)
MRVASQLEEGASLPNVLWVGNKGLEAAENQIIVELDEYKSGYECQLCGDKEHRIVKGGEAGKTESVIACDNCAGKGRYLKGEVSVRCTHCDGSGKITCPKCDGKGSQNIVIPEEQKGRPTSGVIRSCGECVRRYKLGDRVLCPAYAGHGLTLTGYDVQSGKTVECIIQILLENDILAKIHGGEIEHKMFKSSQALHTIS